MDKVKQYIEKNWSRSIYEDKDGSGFKSMDLPYPYTSPCIEGEGKFYFFFYWDTYFTNVGLLKSGLEDIAKSNIKNMLWLIEKMGFMPNHVGLYNRSQPPYLVRMVREYLEATGDEAFRDECARGLRHEYNFWMTARFSPTGLNRYGFQETAEGCLKFTDNRRVARLADCKEASNEDRARIGGHFLAEAETGWDYCQRFDHECDHYNAVCLNALLYELELWLAEQAPAQGWDDREILLERAAQRRERMHRLLWNAEKGWFFDYDFVKNRQSEVYALSAMQALMSGAATPEQAAAMVENLPKMEGEYGLAVTDERPDCRRYQWAWPNIWPPLAYVAVEGLRRYGFEADAGRIAGKFVETTRRLFEETGKLWEKTDAERGGVSGGEYDAAAMLGWSAGVYLAFLQLVEGE